MSSWLSYKGYYAKPEYSSEDEIFCGRIDGIADLVTFEAENASEVKSAFEEAVDDYLETCKLVGKEPDKVYKGSFNVRIPPALHKELATYAMQRDLSLNEAVIQSISGMLHPLHVPIVSMANGDGQPLFGQVGAYWQYAQNKRPSYIPTLSVSR